MIFTPWQKYRTKKAQEANYSHRNSGSYEKSSHLGIIYHNDDQSKIEDAEKIATLLKMDGKNVKTIAYEQRNSVKHLPYDTFTRANFDIWGRFLGKPLQDFVEADFDFLICLDEEPNLLIKSILAHSKAKCRVGRYNEENQHTFEMLFDNASEGKQWVDNLYEYLKKLS